MGTVGRYRIPREERENRTLSSVVQGTAMTLPLELAFAPGEPAGVWSAGQKRVTPALRGSATRSPPTLQGVPGMSSE